jgi:hypothetical protein
MGCRGRLTPGLLSAEKSSHFHTDTSLSSGVPVTDGRQAQDLLQDRESLPHVLLGRLYAHAVSPSMRVLCPPRIKGRAGSVAWIVQRFQRLPSKGRI